MKSFFLLSSLLGSTGFVVFANSNEVVTDAMGKNGTVGAFGVLMFVIIIMWGDRKRILSALAKSDKRLIDLHEQNATKAEERHKEELRIKEAELPVRLKEAESRQALADAVNTLNKRATEMLAEDKKLVTEG